MQWSNIICLWLIILIYTTTISYSWMNIDVYKNEINDDQEQTEKQGKLFINEAKNE